MTTPPFFIPPSLSLKALLDDIDARIALLDLLEKSLQLYEEDLAVMAKNLAIQHQLWLQLINDLQRLVCGARLLAAQDDEATKKATQARKDGV